MRTLWIAAAHCPSHRIHVGCEWPRTPSSSIATSARSCRTTAMPATVRTRVSARRACGSTNTRRHWPLWSRATGRSFPAISTTASWQIAFPPADEAERMPPADSTKKLTAEQIELLRRWIQEGAEWQAHWSFLPVRRSDPPEAASSQPIDDFIRAKLKTAGVAPAAQADPVTLARRVAFDLTGLPPTAEQVARLAAAPTRRDLSPAGRGAAQFAALRRADGHVVARSGALRRQRRLSRRSAGQRLSVSRIRDSAPSTRTSGSTSSRASNWPATCCRSRPPTTRSPPATTAWA